MVWKYDISNRQRYLWLANQKQKTKNNKDVRCKKQITKVGAANQLAPATDLEVGDALRCHLKSFSTFQQFVKIQRW